MRQVGLTTNFLVLALILALGVTPTAQAGDVTLGLKAWSAALSAINLDSSDDFFPGLVFSSDVADRLWLSAGYLKGEVDFTITDSTASGSIEEVDADLIVGWSFAKLDLGVGYRVAEFTRTISDTTVDTISSGPMVFLGGGDLFGQQLWGWGYYWAAAYMFEDLDDDDGVQEHFNGEGGFRWTSRQNLSILFGYRYKEYSGEGAAGATFSGPVMNLAYTWR